MPYNTKQILRDAGGSPIPQIWVDAMDQFVPYAGRVTAMVMDNGIKYYGATIATRPPADTVPEGATFVAVNTREAWQSNGAEWVPW